MPRASDRTLDMWEYEDGGRIESQYVSRIGGRIEEEAEEEIKKEKRFECRNGIP